MSGIEQDPLTDRSLAGIDMGDDADVTDAIHPVFVILVLAHTPTPQLADGLFLFVYT
jgi:hypothetical protein